MLNNLNPSEIVSLQEFYQFAKKNTPIETWDYIIGAADTETTFKKNRYALDTYAFRPRILNDVEHIDTSIKTCSRMGRCLEDHTIPFFCPLRDTRYILKFMLI